ncbi:hypothetical protein GX411_10595 [Candidatus Fermentibacteria bacterium]|nr:hypothetical protein [Candidatus Fermentibacteria bacterium]
MPAILALLVIIPVEPVPQPGPLLLSGDHPLPGIDMERVADAVETAMELPGVRLGIAVADLGSGDTFVRGDGGPFDAGGVGLVAAAMLASAESAGATGDSMPFGTAEIERWLESEGPGSTFLSSSDASATVITTPGDALELLSMLAHGLGNPCLREEVASPLAGTSLEDIVVLDTFTYGIVERREGSASFAIVALMPDGRMAGIVVLADMLCCPEKADLAFRLVWESL